MIKKIIFIPLSNIGDAVMSLPTLLYLKKIYPSAKFDLICDNRSVEIFQHFPSINKIYIRDKGSSLFDKIKFLKNIRDNDYDLAVDLKTDILLWFIRAKKKFPKANNQLVHSVKKHFMSISCDFEKIPDPKIFIPSKLENKINKQFFSNKEKTISIALGANSGHKIWPTENYVDLLMLLSSKFKNIILVGNIHEMNRAQLFKSLYKKNVLDLCGKLTLLETAAVIKKADFFIGNDSGLGHIASAVNTRSFTIFGDGDPDRYHPWGKKSSWYQNTEKDISLITPEKIYKEVINTLD